MDTELTEVSPAAEMDAATLTKHFQARHAEPFLEVGLDQIAIPPRDMAVWQAYHRREHRVQSGHDHFHRGEDDVDQPHNGDSP